MAGKSAHLVNPNLAGAQEVIQTSWGGNNDLYASLDSTQLWALGGASVNTPARTRLALSQRILLVTRRQ